MHTCIPTGLLSIGQGETCGTCKPLLEHFCFCARLEMESCIAEGWRQSRGKIGLRNTGKSNVIDTCHYSIALGKEVTGNLEYNYERV
jgi:hypothetical protein